MTPREDASPGVQEAGKIQDRLKTAVELANRLGPVRTVGAMDISYNRFSNRAVGVLLTFQFPDLVPLESVYSVGEMRFPYVPGFLAFREGPILLSAFEKVRTPPDLILFDGHGYAHPKRFGIACHLGVLLDVPSIGCAKSVLVGEYRKPGQKKGSRSDLTDAGEKIGTVYRSQTGIKPIFISPGHRIDFVESVNWVTKCLGRYRIPEPIRQAHLRANELRKELLF
jgi:deoxyribonuclease V